MKSIQLLSTEEILAVVKCGILVSMTNANRQFFVNLKDDLLVIQTTAGSTIDSLCSADGSMIRDEFLDYEFSIDYGFTLHGVAMINRKCIDEVLANLRVNVCAAMANKRLAMNAAKSLQDKINCNRHETVKIRQIQNDYDNISMSFWHLVDIIERS